MVERLAVCESGDHASQTAFHMFHMFHMCAVLSRHGVPQPGSLTAPCHLSHHSSPPGTKKRIEPRAHPSPQVISTSHTWSTAIGGTRQPSESIAVRQMRALQANGMRGVSRHDTHGVKTGLILQNRGSGRESANRPTNQNKHSNTGTICVRSKTCKCSISFSKPPRKRQSFFFPLSLSESPKKLLT